MRELNPAGTTERACAEVQMTAARELMRTEAPERRSPRPEEILYWMRVNMPLATSACAVMARRTA